jgi:hypothetical protein
MQKRSLSNRPSEFYHSMSAALILFQSILYIKQHRDSVISSSGSTPTLASFMFTVFHRGGYNSRPQPLLVLPYVTQTHTTLLHPLFLYLVIYRLLH